MVMVFDMLGYIFQIDWKELIFAQLQIEMIPDILNNKFPTKVC